MTDTPVAILTRWIAYIDAGHPSPMRPTFMRALWIADGAGSGLDARAVERKLAALDGNKPEVKIIQEWIKTCANIRS
jgi:hypothetical protein